MAKKKYVVAPKKALNDFTIKICFTVKRTYFVGSRNEERAAFMLNESEYGSIESIAVLLWSEYSYHTKEEAKEAYMYILNGLKELHEKYTKQE